MHQYLYSLFCFDIKFMIALITACISGGFGELQWRKRNIFNEANLRLSPSKLHFTLKYKQGGANKSMFDDTYESTPYK